MSGLLAAYRRTGADPPFSDPARDHGAAMEGYYWRLVHPDAGWVIVWLCGVCRGRGGSWATVALAAHPGGFLRHGTVEPAAGDFDRFGARAGAAFRGSLHELRVRMADDAWVEARLHPRVTWPQRALGALGPGQLIPGLAQYWHPVLLAADIEGEACIGGRRLQLDGARAYAEKNWGPGFAGRWWWGQADAFPDADIGVAFAGGRLPLLGVSAAPTAVVLRLGERVLRFVPPLARARIGVGAHGWRVQMRSARHQLELEGDAGENEPHRLPVPDVAERRVDIRSHQVLAGRLHLRTRRGRRTLIDAASPLAGLELGDRPRPVAVATGRVGQQTRRCA
jgi:Tocopherol cyclase